MKSLQKIDKFCSSPLEFFLNMAYIFMQVIKNGKTFHRLSFFHFLSPKFSYAPCLISFHSSIL